MTFKPLITAACVAAVTLATSSAALAQAAAPAAAAPNITHGAAPAGVCTMSVDGAAAASTVGQYVNTRMQQLAGQVNAELGAERTAIETEAKSLDSQRATLDATTLEQRGSALQVRANALQRKAQQRDREMGATEQKALGRVATEIQPLVTQAYQQKGCSILIRTEALILQNPAMDITGQVVTALNAKITQFAFDRERLDQAVPTAQTGATQAPAATPR